MLALGSLLFLHVQTYKMEAPIECIDPEGGAGKVRVVMVRPDTCVPVLSAVVDMPVSQTGDETV